MKMTEFGKMTRLLLLLLTLFLSIANADEPTDVERPREKALEDSEPDDAILFPWLTMAFGIICTWLISRYFTALPYTAVMFVIGMGMGIGAQRTLNDDRLTLSILQWTQIDSEVLLLVFLPGIVFNDAFGMNVHLFFAAFWQIINFAFPMVLASTCLTALVAFFLFPYGWSWNLAMTFGSILAATDPAAVASLMESLGAPPRLQMHIGGESTWNDGSSYVFYTIFGGMFLTELGIPGVGEEVDLGRGVAIFFREAFGAIGYGILFGLGLTFLLYIFNRKLNDAENVVQILCTITVAYLAYYTADISGCSGVISVLGCGVTTKIFGNTMINDHQMMDSFWALVVQSLNTVLFTLAGVVFGAIIGDATGVDIFNAKDWGYLIMNYVLLNVSRYFLLFSFYPVTTRIGIGTDWQETVFSGYAGLRGGVGMSLGLSLYNQVFEATSEANGTNDPKFQVQATQLFAQVGGIVLFTLVINGTTAGPLLNALGLAKSPESRTWLLKQLEKHFHQHVVDEFVKLLTDPRFQDVEFPVVQHYVPTIKDLTVAQLKDACLRNPKYKPNLHNVLPYLDTEGEDLTWANVDASETKAPPVLGTIAESALPVAQSSTQSSKDANVGLTELRHFFLEVLSTVYNSQLDNGELDGRDGFVAYSLTQSIDFASSDVDRGKPLDDWKASQVVDKFFNRKWVTSGANFWEGMVNKDWCCIRYSKNRVGDDRAHTLEYRKLKTRVLRALSFLEAHRQTRETFSANLSGTSEEYPAENTVLKESQDESDAAQQVIDDADQDDVAIITAHYFCSILLNKEGKYTQHLLDEGILETKEASVYQTKIDAELLAVNSSSIMGGASRDEVSKPVKSSVTDDVNASVRDSLKDSKIVSNGQDEDAEAVDYYDSGTDEGMA